MCSVDVFTMFKSYNELICCVVVSLATCKLDTPSVVNILFIIIIYNTTNKYNNKNE